MTDLTERLDRHLLNDDAEQRWLDADNLIEEALAEIQLCSAEITRLRDAVSQLRAAIERRTKQLAAAKRSEKALGVQVAELTDIADQCASLAERTDGYGVPVWENGPGIAMEIRAKFGKEKL